MLINFHSKIKIPQSQAICVLSGQNTYPVVCSLLDFQGQFPDFNEYSRQTPWFEHARTHTHTHVHHFLDTKAHPHLQDITENKEYLLPLFHPIYPKGDIRRKCCMNVERQKYRMLDEPACPLFSPLSHSSLLSSPLHQPFTCWDFSQSCFICYEKLTVLSWQLCTGWSYVLPGNHLALTNLGTHFVLWIIIFWFHII